LDFTTDPAARTAWIILAVLAAALLAKIIAAHRRTHYTPLQSLLYLTNRFFSRVLWRTTISGPLPVADSQGAVIVCNHSSGIDPCLIQLCTNRVVHWMVAREYYEAPGMSIVFRSLGSIPVNRAGVDTASTKTAIRLAQQGGLVGLFPEGRVNLTDALLLPGRPGAALIALKARVPVIPCYVSGAPYDGTALGSLMMPGNGHVQIGKPIDLSPYYDRDDNKSVLEELTKKFLVEIAKLAGVDHFEPKLAGKHWKPGLEDQNGDGAADVDTPHESPAVNAH
jgi:1-acyl-sn-glycerol-3-phosphate acyltransferase